MDKGVLQAAGRQTERDRHRDREADKRETGRPNETKWFKEG